MPKRGTPLASATPAPASARLHGSDTVTDRPTAALCRVFYVSRSLAGVGEIDRLIATARRRNSEAGISGLLVFTGGHFAQWIEGAPLPLAATMARIEADGRHTSVSRLLDGPAPQRRFPQWSMGLLHSTGADDLLQQLMAGPPVSAERAERLIERLQRLAALPDETRS